MGVTVENVLLTNMVVLKVMQNEKVKKLRVHHAFLSKAKSIIDPKMYSVFVERHSD